MEIELRNKMTLLSEKTVNLYIGTLRRLNNGNEIINLDFLMDIVGIENKISSLKPNTRRNIMIAINKTLNLYKDAPAINELYKKYQPRLLYYNETLKEEESKNIKSQTQIDNWKDYDDIIEIRDNIRKEINKYPKIINKQQYKTLLKYTILCLYTMTPPRRNKDYLNMVVITDSSKMIDKTNYLVIEKTKTYFSFGDYKTVSKLGRVNITVPTELIEVIKIYCRYAEQTIGSPLLINYNKEPLKESGEITLLLNSIFDKKISSSMLRHIYLSKKYASQIEEQEKDSIAMAHSLDMQKKYIKKN